MAQDAQASRPQLFLDPEKKKAPHQVVAPKSPQSTLSLPGLWLLSTDEAVSFPCSHLAWGKKEIH